MEVLKLKITEKELTEKVKIFEKQDIILQFDDLLEATIEMYNIHIKFNIKNGILHIEDGINDNEIRIDIVSAYKIEADDDYLKIFLDNELELTFVINCSISKSNI